MGLWRQGAWVLFLTIFLREPSPDGYPAHFEAKQRRSMEPQQAGSLCFAIFLLVQCRLNHFYLPFSHPSPSAQVFQFFIIHFKCTHYLITIPLTFFPSSQQELMVCETRIKCLVIRFPHRLYIQPQVLSWTVNSDGIRRAAHRSPRPPFLPLPQRPSSDFFRSSRTERKEGPLKVEKGLAVPSSSPTNDHCSFGAIIL